MIEKFIDHILKAPFNITGLKSADAIHQLLIEPSYDLMEFIKGKYRSVTDGGTGAGIPGIPLALELPETRFFLIDSRKKKADYLRTWVEENRIGNVQVLGCRVEESGLKTSCGLARGMGALSDVLKHFTDIIIPGGELFIQCGPKVKALEKGGGFRLKADDTKTHMRILIYEKK